MGSQKPRLFLGPMTGSVYVSTNYTVSGDPGMDFFTAKTKHDVSDDLGHAMRLYAAGAVDPPKDEHGTRYVVLMEEDLRHLAAAAETLLIHLNELAGDREDTTRPVIKRAIQAAKTVLHAHLPTDPEFSEKANLAPTEGATD